MVRKLALITGNGVARNCVEATTSEFKNMTRTNLIRFNPNTESN